jgi:hypothetical protein
MFINIHILYLLINLSFQGMALSMGDKINLSQKAGSKISPPAK